ncbi:hypothetical protein IPC321_28095 [Pseudomonas aeruginosa]|nr:hypothetical protein IPC321_28095 [Pseudomonas aeruginosa]
MRCWLTTSALRDSAEFAQWFSGSKIPASCTLIRCFESTLVSVGGLLIYLRYFLMGLRAQLCSAITAF